jgi:HAE1 family hydrophobic/amphiphilic exporter-1
MSLARLSIQQPVLAVMLNMLLILFGLIAFQRLGVDRFPYIEFPVVSITTILPGGNPDIMDSSVTNIIETAVNSVPGIDSMLSTSSPGVSQIAITFELSKNIDVAFNEVQAKVNQILRQLPNAIEPPVVAKVQTNAQPIIWLALQGDRTLQQLNEYARQVIKKQLETIDGIGEVRLGGERARTIRVELDPKKMTALGITPHQVASRFAQQHLQMPGGFLVSDSTEQLLKLDLEFHSVAQLKAMLISEPPGPSIRLQDIAAVSDDLADFRSLARFNGQPTIGLGIVKVANANTVKIVNEIKQRLASEITPQLPAGMQLKIASDNSTFILQMVAALQEHLLLGTLLAALVVWLFLKSIGSTLIIVLAIPVSLLGAIAIMLAFGFTINTMTLLALLLLIGVVVDDAIVVLENIFRHQTQSDPITAAIQGTHEVVFAVLAASLTLMAIFAPVIFMGGIIGRFFESFAVVVTFGVAISWLVSMTLTPMLCARYLKASPHQKSATATYLLLERGYQKVIGWVLHYRWTVLGIALALVLSCGYFFAKIGKTFVPEEDEGVLLIMARTPLGASIHTTDERLQVIEQHLAQIPSIASYFSTIGLGQAGVNSSMIFLRMLPKAQRQLTQTQLIQQLSQQLAQIPGIMAFPMAAPIVGGSRGDPLQFVIKGPQLDKVAQLANQLQQRLATVPELGRVDLDLQLDLPQIEVDFDRLRAANLGVKAQDVAMALNIMVAGIDVAKFNFAQEQGERYDIRLKGAANAFHTVEDLSKIYLRDANGQLLRMDTLVTLTQRSGPATISRQDLHYAAPFFSSPTMPLGEAMQKVTQLAAPLLPPGYQLKFLGQAQEFSKTLGYMGFTFLLAMVLTYMILASQFNSLVQPLIIMVAQPLAMVGGIMGLWLTGNTLNIYSMIGLVLLLGLVAKNSILLVDLTNQLRRQGLSIEAALLQACPIRLRPVLMTSLTIILALLPAALGYGAGANTNGPLSIAVIGGMISSTLLTLVVVPALYALIAQRLAPLSVNQRQQFAVPNHS